MKKLLLAFFLCLSTIVATAQNCHNIIVDTDLAVDDYFTVLYALRQKSFNIKAITLEGCGESHCKYGLKNLAKIFALTHSKNPIPIACGQDHPIQGNNHFPKLWRKESDSFLKIKVTPTKTFQPYKNAVTLLNQTINKSNTKTILIATGPLTNIALLIKKHPSIEKKIAKIYIMGGSISRPGNIYYNAEKNILNGTKNTAEWNLYIDPVADKTVIDSGIPIVLVPLNATDYLPITYQFAQNFSKRTTTASGKFIAKVLKKYAYYLKNHDLYFWGAFTAAEATHNNLCKIINLPIAINIQANNRFDPGTTYISKNGPTIGVCTKPNIKKFYHLFNQSFT